MGLQAQGAGLGQGFDQGFGQGLSGDPNGSEPHDGIQVQEEVAPDSGSRDTDLVCVYHFTTAKRVTLHIGMVVFSPPPPLLMHVMTMSRM